jgi:hypothetical protein
MPLTLPPPTPRPRQPEGLVPTVWLESGMARALSLANQRVGIPPRDVRPLPETLPLTKPGQRALRARALGSGPVGTNKTNPNLANRGDLG